MKKEKVVDLPKKYDMKKISMIIASGFIWIYYFSNGMRMDWWKMAIFNAFIIYGIIKAFEDKKNDNRKKAKV